MLAEDVQALDSAGELNGGRDGLLGGAGGGGTAHVDGAVLPLDGGGRALAGAFGLVLAGGGLAPLGLISHFLILLDLFLNAVILLGLALGGVDNLTDGLHDFLGGDVAQLFAGLLAALALLSDNGHSVLNQTGDVSGGNLGNSVLGSLFALGLGLGLLIQGLLDASLDFLGQLIGLHLHRLAASRCGSFLGNSHL